MQTKNMVKSFKDCLPIKVCAAHVLPTGVVAEFIIPVVKFFMSKSLRTRYKVHKPNLLNSSLMQDLQSYGFRPEGLPKVIVGGLYEVNPNWLQERLQFEEDNEL